MESVVIRVLLVDNNPLARIGIAALLKQTPYIQIVAEADSIDVVVDVISRNQPDVVLISLSQSNRSGGTLTRSTSFPHVVTVVYGSMRDQEALLEAVQAGISVFLVDHNAPVQLGYLLTLATAGYTSAPKLLFAHSMKSITPKETDFQLSKREREVLRQLSHGMSNPEIATSLFLSRATVKSHLASIYRKLGVTSRKDAIRIAKLTGLA